MIRNNEVFRCSPEATDYLKKADPTLAVHIERLGYLERRMTRDLFESLVGSIIGQQISGKAATSIEGRVKDLLGSVTPRSVAETEAESIQRCGMSMRKATYIKAAAGAFLDGTIDPAVIPSMEDEEIIGILDALPGVGRWTAQMLLIFSLGRPDILAFDDLAIRKGLARLHGLAEVTRPVFEQYRKLYSPYGSTASIYLWHIAGED